MTSKEKLINQVINGFQKLFGKASCYVFSEKVIPELVYSVLYNFFTKRPNAKVLIVHDDYSTRTNIYNYLELKKYNHENGYSIRQLSYGYIKPQYHYVYDLVITVGVNDDFDIIKHLCEENKFMLTIFTKNIMNNNFIISVRNILPSISTIDVATVSLTERINSPVEEHILLVDLDTDDKSKYDKACEYINNCITAFGSLDNIEKCKFGDKQANISATEFRNNLAKENGWSETLDTKVDYFKQIDDVFNPNVLYDKAMNFYNIAKARRDLVTDNDAKLSKILDIIKENENKRILIVSKRGDYAKRVAKYINEHYDKKCGEYHDCIDDAVAVDNNNNVIYIKSGKNKGKPKILASQAQSTLYEQRFNAGDISILSIKEKSDIKLKIACDLVIFTSPLCDNICDLKARFVNVTFVENPTFDYIICCRDTIETQKIYDNTCPQNVKRIFDDEENNITYDEISGDIIL